LDPIRNFVLAIRYFTCYGKRTTEGDTMNTIFILTGFFFGCGQKEADTSTQNLDTPVSNTQPTSEPASQPNSDPTAEATAEPTAEPGSQPSSEPASQPTSDPTSEPASQPSSEPNDCSAESTFKDCFACYAEEFPNGYNVYATSVITYCYCGIECGSDCSEFCASGGDGSVQASTSCETCVQTVSADQTSQCISDFSGSCSTEPDCITFANSLSNCTPP